MIDNRVTFYKGIVLLVCFTIVLCLIFSPIFNNRNGLEYLDDLYNSISKGSACYIPKLQKEIKAFKGKSITMNLKMESGVQARQIADLIQKAGARAQAAGTDLKIEGSLGNILDSCLKDADLMYMNNGSRIRAKYGVNERKIIYNWWVAANLMDKELKKQKLFKEALIVTNIKTKGLETSYNYYKIEPQKISAKWGIVLFSLIFYIIYTIWYGFAIMFLFEGWGLRLDH